jgi:hypothetical protein
MRRLAPRSTLHSNRFDSPKSPKSYRLFVVDADLQQRGKSSGPAARRRRRRPVLVQPPPPTMQTRREMQTHPLLTARLPSVPHRHGGTDAHPRHTPTHEQHRQNQTPPLAHTHTHTQTQIHTQQKVMAQSDRREMILAFPFCKITKDLVTSGYTWLDWIGPMSSSS